MEVTTDTFQIVANLLHEGVVDMNNVEHDLWIVLSPFRALRYINVGRTLPQDKAPWLERVNIVRKINDELKQARSQDGPAFFQFHRILAI